MTRKWTEKHYGDFHLDGGIRIQVDHRGGRPDEQAVMDNMTQFFNDQVHEE
jgi:hypothetical protein